MEAGAGVIERGSRAGVSDSAAVEVDAAGTAVGEALGAAGGAAGCPQAASSTTPEAATPYQFERIRISLL